ncbi:hypothetical protein TNCV_1452551 [Trichonephila clavipes]|nr:hypothetical protein TNCV_1452551 [Trichonephila clavipes]
MEADNIDCALVQESHSYRCTLPGYPSTYRLIYEPNYDIIKAAIIVRSRHLSTFIDYKNSDYKICKSELWFSPYSDARGNKLSEFISANNLFIINEDCGPTFRATQVTSYIDITVVGSDLLEDNSSWCLFENESLSDHVMIEFEFCLSTVLRDTSSALLPLNSNPDGEVEKGIAIKTVSSRLICPWEEIISEITIRNFLPNQSQLDRNN